MIKLTTPLTDEKIKNLKAGDNVLLSGTIYTARDAAHERLVQLLDKGEIANRIKRPNNLLCGS